MSTNTAELIAGVMPGGDDGRAFEIIRLGGGADGIAQISEALAGRTDIAAIHLLSHGTDGRVELGSGGLDFESLLANATQIRAWDAALTADADILIYGCDVAAQPGGKALIDALARLTGRRRHSCTNSDGTAASVTARGAPA